MDQESILDIHLNCLVDVMFCVDLGGLCPPVHFICCHLCILLCPPYVFSVALNDFRLMGCGVKMLVFYQCFLVKSFIRFLFYLQSSVNNLLDVFLQLSRFIWINCLVNDLFDLPDSGGLCSFVHLLAVPKTSKIQVPRHQNRGLEASWGRLGVTWVVLWLSCGV